MLLIVLDNQESSKTVLPQILGERKVLNVLGESN